MAPKLTLHTNRLRANSFGAAPTAYDAYRPRYPDLMIDDLLAEGPRRILDVGAGTGIASHQFAERGVEVLAVEPDARMAAVTRLKGIPVEIDTFEHWDPAERHFDMVVFAASFHWVDPSVALSKVHAVLRDAGSLALLWNHLRPVDPPREDFAAIYADCMDTDTEQIDSDPGCVVAALTAAGFSVDQRWYPRTDQYSRQQWIDFAFTHSTHLTLDEERATELRARMAELIGPDGVSVSGRSLALVATPTTSPGAAA